jgi:hypothetical protein
MTEEELDELLKEQQHIADQCGTISYAHFLEFKENVINGLMLFGSKFQEALGMALDEAEDRDAVKIIRIWRNECGVHEMLYKMHLAKQAVRDLELDNAKQTLDSIQL